MKDLEGYLKRMEDAMNEKMRFLKNQDFSKYDLVVDFGCANGELLRRIEKDFRRSDTLFLGYDKSEKMIEKAVELSKGFKIAFTEDLDLVKKLADIYDKKAIIFSSVLHEISSFDLIHVVDLMKQFDAVLIRDMFFDDKYSSMPVVVDSINKIASRISNYQFTSFCENWGDPFNSVKNFYHLLLKYEYVDNWETEVKEDYFGVDWDYIRFELNKAGLKVVFEYDYTLQYKKSKVVMDFNYFMGLPTHKVIIFEKEGYYNE